MCKVIRGELLKAAVLEELGKIVVQQVPDPLCDDNSVVVKIRACAVCGSDLRIMDYGNDRVTLPQILGHEIAGEVVKVGKNVTRFQEGDTVAVGADVPCGECGFCIEGIGNNCQTNYAIGYQFAGGFAEYIVLNKLVVDYGPVQKIPQDANFNEYALAEPLGCVLNAVELSDVRLGNTVVIIGCGPIGCMMIPVVKKAGASLVIGIERSQDRQEAAMRFGADVVIDHSRCDIVAEVKKHTRGLGANVIFTATPVPDMQAKAIRMAQNRARINLFGGLPKDKAEVTLDTNLIHYKELFVHGSHGAMPRHHLKAVELIRSGAIKMEPFISHEFSLDRINEAVETAKSRACMRVVIRPWG
jgi:L-iditol 2-dehydrogenase